MDSEEKYRKVISLVKRSTPVLNDPGSIRENVLKEVKRLKNHSNKGNFLEEILFGWIYIGWIRKSLITIAAAVIVFFGYQQAVILRKINSLSQQRYISTTESVASMTDDISARLALYRIAGKKFTDLKLNISEKEIDELVVEIKKLKVKYEDLIYMIENDSQLNEYFEKKLNQDLSPDNLKKKN
jgi:hypothetical protein